MCRCDSYYNYLNIIKPIFQYKPYTQSISLCFRILQFCPFLQNPFTSMIEESVEIVESNIVMRIHNSLRESFTSNQTKTKKYNFDFVVGSTIIKIMSLCRKLLSQLHLQERTIHVHMGLSLALEFYIVVY